MRCIPWQVVPMPQVLRPQNRHMRYIWGVLGDTPPKNGWFIKENQMKMDD